MRYSSVSNCTLRLSKRRAEIPPILATSEQVPTAWFLQHHQMLKDVFWGDTGLDIRWNKILIIWKLQKFLQRHHYKHPTHHRRKCEQWRLTLWSKDVEYGITWRLWGRAQQCKGRQWRRRQKLQTCQGGRGTPSVKRGLFKFFNLLAIGFSFY